MTAPDVWEAFFHMFQEISDFLYKIEHPSSSDCGIIDNREGQEAYS
jgi:hypothetical protein